MYIKMLRIDRLFILLRNVYKRLVPVAAWCLKIVKDPWMIEALTSVNADLTIYNKFIKHIFGNCATLKCNLYSLSLKFYLQARSCSSGKQRRSRFPSTFMDKDCMPKMSFLAEEKLVGSVKGGSPSPLVSRSISTDSESVIKSKVKKWHNRQSTNIEAFISS